jgi:hypothetical protein
MGYLDSKNLYPDIVTALRDSLGFHFARLVLIVVKTSGLLYSGKADDGLLHHLVTSNSQTVSKDFEYRTLRDSCIN